MYCYNNKAFNPSQIYAGNSQNSERKVTSHRMEAFPLLVATGVDPSEVTAIALRNRAHCSLITPLDVQHAYSERCLKLKLNLLISLRYIHFRDTKSSTTNVDGYEWEI